MAFDSTADLLFNIGANTDEAEGNLQRFRALMGKDLGALTGEFDEWATHLLGDITTVGFSVLTANWGLIGGQMLNIGLISGVTVFVKDFLSTNSDSLLAIGPASTPAA